VPLILVFNKADEADTAQLKSWLDDPDCMREAFKKCGEDAGFLASLQQSLALALSEFTVALPPVCVSAITGEGMGDLVDAIERERGTWREDTKERLKQAKEEQEQREADHQSIQMQNMAEDMAREKEFSRLRKQHM
ncbi:GPN-loop GTPase 1, partial [Kipferlia bialata]